MGRFLDFLTGRKAEQRKAYRAHLSMQEDIAVDEVSAQLDEVRHKRAALDAVVEDLKERRRGQNA